MKNQQIIFAISLFIICLLSYKCFSNNNNSKSENGIELKENSDGKFLQLIPEKFIGVWKGDCDMSAGKIEINKGNSISMEINSGQVYITAKAKISDQSSDILELYLDMPGDCGPGGAGMAWADFSRTKPICSLDFSTVGSPKINWVGFFNEKTKEVEWKDGPDWVSDSFNGLFKKCVSINSQFDIQGDMGQITFSQENANGENVTIFYFKKDIKKGKIVINDIEYIINNFSYVEKGENHSFRLTGDKVKIESSLFEDSGEGEDCLFGSVKNVTITIDGIATTINEITVQDCPLSE